MWREPQQSASLRARLEHEVQVSVLEISHATMNQPRRAARRSAGEVAFLDERNRETTQSRIARDRAASDTAPDHEQVELSRLECGETL